MRNRARYATFEEEFEIATLMGQTVAIHVLVGLFTFIVMLLGIACGVAVMVVCQAFALLRVTMRLILALIEQVEQRQSGAHPSFAQAPRRRARRARYYSPRRPVTSLSYPFVRVVPA